jgi:outer membrane protein assembly factor BamE (lipoprotein component of BamABCDE complex)
MYKERVMTVRSILVVLALVVFAGSGCMTASRHAEDVQQGLEGDKLTVGTVQREVRQGMSGAEVVEVLGSPNIVSTDEKGREVWVYDRISTDTVRSSSSGGILALIFGTQGGGGGGALGHAGYDTGAKSTSQRTLTVIIKFDEAGKVRDFDYHATRF